MSNNIDELETKLQKDLDEIKYLIERYDRFRELINIKINKAKDLKLDIDTQKEINELPEDLFIPEE